MTHTMGALVEAQQPLEPQQYRVRFDTARDGTWKPHYVNGREIPDWESGPDMRAYTKLLWDQGLQRVIDLKDGEFLFEPMEEYPYGPAALSPDPGS